MASSLDGWARWLGPALYIFVMIIVFNLDLTDRYADNSLTQAEQSFYGFGPASLTAQGTVMIIVYTVGVITVAYASHKLNSISRLRAEELQAILKTASREEVENMTKQQTEARASMSASPGRQDLLEGGRLSRVQPP